MRKVFLTASILFSVTALFAQRSAMTTGKLAMDAESYAKAKENFDQCVKHEKTKTDPKAWYYRGQCYQRLALINIGEYKFNPNNNVEPEDVEEFKSLTTDPTKHALESYQNCLKYDEKGRYDRKVDKELLGLAFLQYNAAAKSYQEALSETGTIEDKSKMIECYEYYNDLFTTKEMMSDPTEKRFMASMQQSGINDMNTIKMNQANAAFYGEDYEKAKKTYNQLVVDKYEDFLVYRNLSKIYMSEKDTAAAKEIWAKGKANFPKNKDLALDEAIFYQEIGETDVLMEKLDAAIELDPSNASLYNVQGGLLTQMVVDHNNAKSEGNEEKMLNEEVAEKYSQKAEELLLKAQELKGDEVTNYTQLGSLYLSEGLVAYNKNQNLGISKSDLAKSEKLQKTYKEKFGQAQKQYEQALEIDPNNAISLDYLSKIHMWLGNTAKSIEYKKKLQALKNAQNK